MAAQEPQLSGLILTDLPGIEPARLVESEGLPVLRDA